MARLTLLSGHPLLVKASFDALKQWRYRPLSHDPTGASKWNRIEHRLFSEISKTGAANRSIATRKFFASFAPPELKPVCRSPPTWTVATHPSGTEPAPEQLQALRIQPHEVLPRWNYTILTGYVKLFLRRPLASAPAANENCRNAAYFLKELGFSRACENRPLRLAETRLHHLL